MTLTFGRSTSAAFDLDDLARSVRAGERAALGRAITLIESKKPAHEAEAQALLLKLMPATGAAHRVGITGAPGVGKSTLIDALGRNLTAAGRKVAVLAVDPTSQRSGGSILGDKTRMAALAAEPNAFIRPSPTSGTLGGVARRTRETMLACEAAGHDVVLVETVGVGQSETAVAGMVDFFLVLMLPGGGDELQGIKKGVIELADLIAVNKADGDSLVRARHTAADYRAALNVLTPASPNWRPEVVLISSAENRGLDELWGSIERHRQTMSASGELAARRREQQLRWFRSLLEERLLGAVRSHPQVRAELPAIEAAVAGGELTPVLAVARIAALMGL